MKTIEGKLVVKDAKIAIVASRFNDFITEELISGALDCLRRHEVDEEGITIVRVPGAFEIPLIAKKLAESGKYEAIVTLGAVIKGSTDHYQFVASEVAKGIASVSLSSGVPVLFGVLTTNNIEQAIERAGTKAGNKGYDTALDALEMISLNRSLG